MKFIFFMILVFFLTNCSSTKKVYLCGDRECVNKKEANQYFEENLYLEVMFKDKKKIRVIDLVKLNTGEIKYKEKEKKNENFFKLNNKEKKIIKKQVKIKENILKKEIKKSKKTDEKPQKNYKILKKIFKNKKNEQNNFKKEIAKTSDICLTVENCDIDKIS